MAPHNCKQIYASAITPSAGCMEKAAAIMTMSNNGKAMIFIDLILNIK